LLVRKLSTCNVTRSSVTKYTKTCHWTLCWADWIYSAFNVYCYLSYLYALDVVICLKDVRHSLYIS
jgi:hypothetical protein